MANSQSSLSDKDAVAGARRLLAEVRSDYESLSVKLNFKAEAEFIGKFIEKWDKHTKSCPIAQAAMANPSAFKSAITSQAAIGLTFSPVLDFAYLLVRGGRVVLDVSYRGLLKLAVDSGAIKSAKAELVYSNDTFEYYGPSRAPNHVVSKDVLMSGRGQFLGVYTLATLPDGSVQTDLMTAEEVDTVRDCSLAKNGPWKSFFGQMAKKASLKRARTTWPYAGDDDRMARAIAVVNEHEGGFSPVTGDDEPGSAESTPPREFDDRRGWSDEDVTEQLKAGVAEVIRRCQKMGGYAAGFDYVKERLRGPSLAYARHMLEEARQSGAKAA